MSDTQRLHKLLQERQGQGLHSHQARQMGISGNPSQRAKDLASSGVDVRKRRETRNGRNGIRFWLGRWAPPDAEPVVPNPGAERAVDDLRRESVVDRALAAAPDDDSGARAATHPSGGTRSGAVPDPGSEPGDQEDGARLFDLPPARVPAPQWLTVEEAIASLRGEST